MSKAGGNTRRKNPTVECSVCGESIKVSSRSKHMNLHTSGKEKRPRSMSASAVMCRNTRLSAESEHGGMHNSDERLEIDSTFSPDTTGEALQRALEITLESPEPRFADLTYSQYSAASMAASSLLTAQYEKYDVAHLTRFIADNCQTEPSAIHPYIAIGVAAGAKHAINLTSYLEKIQDSTDPE